MAMSPELERILTTAQGPDVNESGKIIDSIRDAQKTIQPFLKPSPLRRSLWLSELTGGDVYLKLECFNPKGSFKIRGALTAISRALVARAQKPGASALKVCAASAGNHAQGVALAAKWLGCEAHIFLPKLTPLVKRQSTEQLGAKVYVQGDNIEDAFEAAIAFAAQSGAQLIHAYNDFDIIAGQGTCGLEMLEQFSADCGDPKTIDYALFSVGGGGLAAGAGFVLREFTNAEVIGVEQKHFDSAFTSFQRQAQSGVSVGGLKTIADGIAVRQIGNLNFRYLRHVMKQVMLVNDDQIVGALLGLCEHERVVAEGAGAATIAAILKNPKMFQNKVTIACVSGGNIDPQLLTRVIARGMNVTGRVLNLTARIGDRPGHLAHLLEEIARLDVNVLEVHHDRTYSQVNVGDVGVELALETKNFEHQYELIERLDELGYEPKIPHP